MRDKLVHRGPDGRGEWWSADGAVGLGHRRLAIIDLSEDANQPMLNEELGLCIVFNGEIYNYKRLRAELASLGFTFRSQSDTEVVLASYAAWGADCPARLDGMFAFAIFDCRRNRLFMARDRAGEKPLFYCRQGRSFAFASEPKALLACPWVQRHIDGDSLNFFLAYGYVPGERCLFQGIRKLLPGSAFVYEPANEYERQWRYWELPPRAEPELSSEEALCRVEAVLRTAVNKQLVADVPVGILLSGGLDSSLIAALAAEAGGERIKTFTIAFPGHGEHDEGPYARRVADYFGTEHIELPSEPASVELLPLLARQFDEPIADHAFVPLYMVSKLVAAHAKVALGGDGGDELFGGYPHYKWAIRQEKIRRSIPAFLRLEGAMFGSRLLPVGSRGRNHLIGLAGPGSNGLAHVNLYFDAHVRRRLLSADVLKDIDIEAPEKWKRSLCDPAESILQQAMRADFKTTMADAYLVKADRASMLASLELRAPFLDYHLAELAFSRIADRDKATKIGRKVLLRELGRKLLPPDFNLERKQGFSMPLRNWFKGEWGDFMSSVLADADYSFLRKDSVQEVVRLQRKGFNNENRLFALVMLELWRREYQVSLA